MFENKIKNQNNKSNQIKKKKNGMPWSRVQEKIKKNIHCEAYTHTHTHTLYYENAYFCIMPLYMKNCKLRAADEQPHIDYVYISNINMLYGIVVNE